MLKSISNLPLDIMREISEYTDTVYWCKRAMKFVTRFSKQDNRYDILKNGIPKVNVERLPRTFVLYIKYKLPRENDYSDRFYNIMSRYYSSRYRFTFTKEIDLLTGSIHYTYVEKNADKHLYILGGSVVLPPQKSPIKKSPYRPNRIPGFYVIKEPLIYEYNISQEELSWRKMHLHLFFRENSHDVSFSDPAFSKKFTRKLNITDIR